MHKKDSFIGQGDYYNDYPRAGKYPEPVQFQNQTANIAPSSKRWPDKRHNFGAIFMNKMMLTLLLLAAVVTLPAIASPTIKMLNDSTPAYTAQILQDGFGGYSAGTILQTFCLEAGEYFTPGNSYYAELNTAAVSGGQDWAGGIYGQTPRHSVSSDPIDSRTAYLFTMFIQDDSRFTDQNKLQTAIHYIEAENTTSNSYVTLANQAVAIGGEWYGKGLGNVRVLNLWEQFDGQTFRGASQDQLVMINPVPVPGAVILGSIGVFFVGYLRRRNFR